MGVVEKRGHEGISGGGWGREALVMVMMVKETRRDGGSDGGENGW